ncbi:hypothetical protein DO97_18915 [Neosynechococcus sphagnicola sy1]|uniref:Uncharacterized protein n=1 Tax=Neosynechococcus sphagnicola sy1 TaxID=1497020 RepID=A0A098TNW1_9CYAN|nr:hypothetical protein [Neosynechococcus sphagnicola]KGF73557.1 hypothetical protein DO97_18915 [Neosynechococcus sphagnicola sy1]
MGQDPRQKVWELCQVDLDAAYCLAHKAQWYWYRCQALAAVAWHTKPKPKFLKIANEALEAAAEIQEPNRIVSCSAWVIYAMANRSDVSIQSSVEKLLEVIRSEENPVCQADALLLLFEAVFRKKNMRKIVLSPLLEACQKMKSWKQPRILKDISLILAIDDLTLANEVVEMIKKESIRQQAKESIDKGKWLGAHEFFPYYAKCTS